MIFRDTDSRISVREKMAVDEWILSGNPVGVKGRNSDNQLYKKEIGWVVSDPLFIGLEKTYKWIDDIRI